MRDKILHTAVSVKSIFSLPLFSRVYNLNVHQTSSTVYIEASNISIKINDNVNLFLPQHNNNSLIIFINREINTGEISDVKWSR